MKMTTPNAKRESETGDRSQGPQDPNADHVVQWSSSAAGPAQNLSSASPPPPPPPLPPPALLLLLLLVLILLPLVSSLSLSSLPCSLPRPIPLNPAPRKGGAAE
eukprot:7578081-Pyramimonas_sp.AAC.1